MERWQTTESSQRENNFLIILALGVDSYAAVYQVSPELVSSTIGESSNISKVKTRAKNPQKERSH